MDEEISELFRVLIEGQIRTNKSVNELALTVTRYVDAANARMTRIGVISKSKSRTQGRAPAR